MPPSAVEDPESAVSLLAVPDDAGSVLAEEPPSSLEPPPHATRSRRAAHQPGARSMDVGVAIRRSYRGRPGACQDGEQPLRRYRCTSAAGRAIVCVEAAVARVSRSW